MNALSSRFGSVALIAGASLLAPACGSPSTGGETEAASTAEALTEDAGKIVTLVSSKTAITDFDVDGAGVVFATHDGAISTCPAGGCTGAPTVLAAAGTYSPNGPADNGGGPNVRIGSDGLYVLDVDLTAAHVDLFAQSRTGAGSRILYGFKREANQLSAQAFDFNSLGSRAEFAVEFTDSEVPEAPIVQIDDVAPGLDGGAAHVVEFGGGNYEQGFAVFTVTDSNYYLAQNTIPTGGPPGPTNSTIEFSNLRANKENVTPYLTSSPVQFASIAASSEFVIWGGYTYESHLKAFAVYACAAGSACSTPVQVAGLNASEFVGTFQDTLFVVDEANNLSFANAADILAGNANLTLLASAVPSFSRLVANGKYVYLLRSDGSAILRVTR